MIRLMLPLALPAAMSACAPMPPPGPVVPAGVCNADNARWAIGRAATPDVVERVRIDTGSAVARVIAPGMMVTMDHREDRVNVKTNERNAIVEITCG
jgi:hypothetical protein